MRVVGIDVASNCIRWIILDGDKTGGIGHYFSQPKIDLPIADPVGIANFLYLKDIIRNKLIAEEIEFVAIAKASNDCSSDRCKIECMIEIAAYESHIPYILITPQSRSASEKNIGSKYGGSLEGLFFDSKDICPKYLRNAAFYAWGKLKNV